MALPQYSDSEDQPPQSHQPQHTHQSQHYEQQSNDNNDNKYNENHPSSLTNNYNTSHQPHSDQSNSQYNIQSNDNNESKYQNDAARRTVILSDRSSNTHFQRPNQLQIQSYQSQHNQPQYSSQHNYDPYDYNDEKSVALSTVAPPRQQYVIPRRPDFLEDYPLSHAKPIQLTVNAINAKPIIRGILYRYNVRFHANSDDPNHADIPENNRARRYDIIRKELFREIRQVYGKFDFDNTIIYCDHEIKQEHSFEYDLNTDDDEKGNPKKGTVRIQFNAKLDFNNTDAIRSLSHEYISQIVHVLHRNNMRKIGYVTFGRSHYIDPDKILSLNIRDYPYLEAMHGFLCTMQYTERGTIMYLRNKLRLKEKRRICDVMDIHWNNAQSYEYEHNDRKKEMFETECRKELNGRSFITLYARRCIRKINDINFNKGLDNSFRRNEQWITFRQYFKDVYKQDLHQNFPGLIEVKNRNGSCVYYPPELCYLTGYPDKLRYDKKITGIIARNTSIPVRERLDNFEKVKAKLNLHNQSQAREHRMVSQNIVGHTRHVEYGQHLLQVNGYRIIPSTIIYNSIQANGPTIINDDQLLRCLKDIRPFANLGAGNNGQIHYVQWGIVYMVHEAMNMNDREQSDKWCYEQLCQAFTRFSNEWFPNSMQNDMELRLDLYPRVIELRVPKPDQNNMQLYLKKIVKCLEDNIITYKLEGIVFILPSICSRDDARMSDIYNTIKALCNVKTGTVTQCIRANTISPSNQRNDNKTRNKIQNCLRGTFRQFMTKLGVIPWKVMFANMDVNDNNNPRINYLVDGAISFNVPTILIGIDVNHNRRKGVSTVGFISTYERDFCRVMGQVDTQQMGQEVIGIQKLQMLTENAIINFQKVNGVSPQQIFVYRDGVSLGELNKVSKKELLAVRRAASNVSHDFPNPKIEFMIVQKRVNARFFEWNEFENGLKGAKPRVIVDSDIVSTEFWDFYLIACGAPKDKVANPVRVIIINDDLKLGEKNSKNDIELFTYALCNLYYGWGGAVKVPHVIKYADKIAEMYSNVFDYMNLINTQKMAQPNIDSGINLSHHFL